MPELLTNFLTSNPFLPQGYCYLWNPELIWLHAASDALIALSYYSIPLMMAYFLYRRRDLPFSWVIWLFGAFIVACGTSHLIDIWTLWHPTYWLSGIVKFITAIISVYTAVSLLPLMPQALSIPSPPQLEAANEKLAQEIRDRTAAQAQISQLNAELELRVSRRTAQLRESQERFRLLVEGVQDYALVMLDPEGKVVSWNSGAERITGFKAEEIMGQYFSCFYEEEAVRLGKPEEFLEIVLAEGHFQQEGWRLRKDGSRFWANVAITSLRDEAGMLRGFSKVTRDATQRKMLQEKLLCYSYAIALTGSAIRITNADNQSIYHNQAFIDLFGYTVDELNAVGGPIALYLSPEVGSEVYQIIINTGCWSGEIELRTKSGAIVQTLLRIDSIFDDAGNRLGLVGVCTDISERKLAEAALQQAKAELERRVEERTQELSEQNLALRQSEVRLTEKNEQLKEALRELKQTQSQLIQTEKMSSLGQLVAGVAHEINNPVNFIYGNISHASSYFAEMQRIVGLYQQYYPQPLPEIQIVIDEIEFDFLLEDLPKVLDSMRLGAERIREIVQSLRNFSRLDEAEMKPVDIHEGIDSTLLILQNRLREKPGKSAIAVIKEYGKLPKVDCFPGQLNQVFMNVLANAIDVLETQPSPRFITIRTEVGIGNWENRVRDLAIAPSSYPEFTTDGELETEDSKLPNPEFVLIWITDNGPGMPQEVRRRIFDPFFTTKPVGQGTGLGLSISYQIIVQKHGGVFKCISEPGCGATFAIAIPVWRKYSNRQGG